jgi:hypothetical protein
MRCLESKESRIVLRNECINERIVSRTGSKQLALSAASRKGSSPGLYVVVCFDVFGLRSMNVILLVGQK